MKRRVPTLQSLAFFGCALGVGFAIYRYAIGLDHDLAWAFAYLDAGLGTMIYKISERIGA